MVIVDLLFRVGALIRRQFLGSCRLPVGDHSLETIDISFSHRENCDLLSLSTIHQQNKTFHPVFIYFSLIMAGIVHCQLWMGSVSQISLVDEIN